MSQEQTTNFATSTLTSALSINGTSFTVSSGQGALFPASTFLVTIEGEVLLIVSRSTDTFTIASNGRAFDGSIADSHPSGVSVQHTIVAYTLNRLWQQSVDAYHPDVPPKQAILGTNGVPGGTASTYDNEFESVGSWTLSPAPGTKGLFTAGTTMRSHLIFQSPGDGKVYTAWVPFTPSPATFTITMKLSDAVNFSNMGTSKTARTYLFVSDQTSPASNPSTGNYMMIRLTSGASQGKNGLNLRTIQAGSFVSSSFGVFGPSFQLGTGMPIYLRLAYDGTTWSLFYGDGWIYNLLTTTTSPSFTPKSLGLQFVGDSTSNSPYIAAIDFVRVTLGSVLAPYGQ